MADERKPHFFPKNNKTVFHFKSPKTPKIKKVYPSREELGPELIAKYQLLKETIASYENNYPQTKERGGHYLEFSTIKNLFKATNFENTKKGIKLLNAKTDRRDESVVKLSVFVPTSSNNFFEDKINDYATKNTKDGNPKNQACVGSICDISMTVIEDLWMDDEDQIPTTEKKWCEFWFIQNNEEDDSIFKKLSFLDVRYQKDFLSFPEKLIVLCYVNKADMINILNVTQNISEIHLYKEPSSFYIKECNVQEQKQWCDDILNRVSDSEKRSHICIMDTGIAFMHPLLNGVIKQENVHSVVNGYTNIDNDGHGTAMSGICEYYDLNEVIESDEKIKRNIEIESVKIFSNTETKTDDPDLSGKLTQKGIEITNQVSPVDKRVYCLAVTEQMDDSFKGEPTSWSSAVDKLVADKIITGEKLFVISAGNGRKFDFRIHPYPQCVFQNTVQSPAQSWNALSIGAYSSKTIIKEERLSQYSAIAPYKNICPYSSSSINWANNWPVKPEVLFDGGNAFTSDGMVPDTCDDLSLLTLYNRPIMRLFTSINATSAATAQAANVAAEIISAYPNAWSETVRGLIVHSAEWPDTVLSQYRNCGKMKRRNLLRTYGYGIANKAKSLGCLKHEAILIIEDEIQPFIINENGTVTANEMFLHKLPWPKDFLLNLGDEGIRLKVTLSYYIDPSPGRIDCIDKYRYQSAGLVFDLQHPGESLDSFKKRINKALRDENYQKPANVEDNWFLGSENRNVGSIHSDIWGGPASILSDCENIAIIPVTGWWKSKKYANNKMRYSLILSLESDNPNIDIYNAVKTIIDTQVATPIETII